MNSPKLKRKHPSWIAAAAAVSAVLVLAALLLWVARATLAAWAMERVMDEQGLCPCQVEVVSLGLSRGVLSLHRSALGSIAHIAIDYRVTDNVGVVIDRLRIDGARLALAWRDGKLTPAIAVGGGTSSGAGVLPVARIEVVNSSVSLTIDTTVVVADLAGTLVRDPQLVANFDLAVQAPQGQLHSNFTARAVDDGAIEGLFAVSAGDVTFGSLAAKGMVGKVRAVVGAQGLTELDGKFTVQALNTATQAWGAGVVSMTKAHDAGLSLAMQFTPLRLALHSDAVSFTSGAPFAFNGTLDARVLRGVLPGLSIDAGQIAFAGGGTTPNKSTDLRELLTSARLHVELDAAITDVVRTDNTRIAHIAADLACALADGVLVCRSPRGVQLDGITLPATVVAADSALAHISAVRLSATNGAPLIALTATKGTDKLSLTTTLLLQAPTLAIRGPLAAEIMLDAPSPAAESQPLLRAGRFVARGKLVLDRSLGLESISLDVALDGRFTIAPHSGALVAAILEHGRLELPTQGWAAHGVSGRYSAGDTQHLKLSVAAIRNTREPALVAPLRAELDARIGAREISFVADLRDGTGLIDATVTGRHARLSGQGEAILRAQPIVFTDAAALRELSPALAARGFKVRGTLTTGGRTHWGDGPARNTLSLALQAFALDGPNFKASAVNGELQLDSLAPLHSEPGQHLNGVLELPTLKRVPFALRFGLDADKLLVEHARAELFDGAFETTAAQIDLKSAAMRVDLRVVDIELESAFMVLNLEQLKGSGRIAGLLPLRLEGGHLAVAAGHLAATGPGRVQIGASGVTDQLKSYGADVDLAFRVLSDFHYQRLRIDADKTLLGAGKALFHLEGDNPAVMTGQPFVFNISLETDFDYLAKLLLELSGATNRALGWGAGEIIKR